MSATHLNEHDANQGAQSAGEFLGMTGNSGWYLLASGGATILMVVLLWGLLGISLLICLLIGVVLCGASVAYVFALRNNKPEHYDTDFFESALVEAGLVTFRFGPSPNRPANPFLAGAAAEEPGRTARRRPAPASRTAKPVVSNRPTSPSPIVAAASNASEAESDPKSASRIYEEEGISSREAYEQVQEELHTTEMLLEEALLGEAED